MPARALRTVLVGCLMCLAAAAHAGGAATIAIPEGVSTHADDGRLPIESLYRASLGLVARGWTADMIVESAPPGTGAALPVIALRSPRPGPAVWILAGIHGEEPAGPNAIAAAIEDIARLGEHRPVVLLPLLNPHGYVRNWRYLNVAEYSESVDGHSVGDSSHLLPDAANPARARSPAPSSPEAAAITAYILAQVADYPPALSLDLHEDNLIDEGYVYSQGAHGAREELAITAVGVLREHGVPIRMGGETRFGEPIERGIVGPVTDSSIDELMSAREVVVGGETRPGPAAEAVLVLETPAGVLPLGRRVAAQAALLRLLAKYLVTVPDGY